MLVPDIDVDNYLDEKENQIVDITFKIRDLPVPQGHTIGLSNGEYYS